MHDEPAAAAVVRHLRSGNASEGFREMPREYLLTVNVNDIPTMQMGCSASHLVELVCGRLYTEGLISSVDEIDTISICENSFRADVYLVNRKADLSRRATQMVPTCCTNNMTLNDYFGQDEALAPLNPIKWDAEWVFRMVDEFTLDRTSHSRTNGSHSAYLADRTSTLYVREDIGRHNAFDKAIGSALIDGVDLSRCLLFTSGRVPTDMVTKAIRARIPLLVSKSAATDKTIEMARAYNLTLICNANPECFEVANDPRTH